MPRKVSGGGYVDIPPPSPGLAREIAQALGKRGVRVSPAEVRDNWFDAMEWYQGCQTLSWLKQRTGW